MWAKIDEFLMSAEPHRYCLKVIWDPWKNSIVSDKALYPIKHCIRVHCIGVPVYHIQGMKWKICEEFRNHWPQHWSVYPDRIKNVQVNAVNYNFIKLIQWLCLFWNCYDSTSCSICLLCLHPRDQWYMYYVSIKLLGTTKYELNSFVDWWISPLNFSFGHAAWTF